MLTQKNLNDVETLYVIRENYYPIRIGHLSLWILRVTTQAFQSAQQTQSPMSNIDCAYFVRSMAGTMSDLHSNKLNVALRLWIRELIVMMSFDVQKLSLS